MALLGKTQRTDSSRRRLNAHCRPPFHSDLSSLAAARAQSAHRTGCWLPLPARLLQLFSRSVRGAWSRSRRLARGETHRALSSVGWLGLRSSPSGQVENTPFLHSLSLDFHG
jgi:hypothetical protein